MSKVVLNLKKKANGSAVGDMDAALERVDMARGLWFDASLKASPKLAKEMTKTIDLLVRAQGRMTSEILKAASGRDD